MQGKGKTAQAWSRWNWQKRYQDGLLSGRVGWKRGRSSLLSSLPSCEILLTSFLSSTLWLMNFNRGDRNGSLYDSFASSVSSSDNAEIRQRPFRKWLLIKSRASVCWKLWPFVIFEVVEALGLFLGRREWLWNDDRGNTRRCANGIPSRWSSAVEWDEVTGSPGEGGRECHDSESLQMTAGCVMTCTLLLVPSSSVVFSLPVPSDRLQGQP